MSSKLRLKDLGELEGKLLVFGGVYSNLQALTALQEAVEDLQPDHIICTGDVVAYCAEPEAAVNAMKAWNVHCIAGNVELNLREGVEDCGCNFNDGSRCDLLSRQWYPYARERVSEASIKWMHQLPDHLRFKWSGREVRVVHGSAFHVSDYVFKSTPWAEKARNFAATEADLILAGHCGIPFQDERDGKQWLNAGVIGMPANDGTPRVWFLMLEPGKEINFRFHALHYDYQTASDRMLAEGLPPTYASTLKTGLWDNCEILPETETCAQGRALELGSELLSAQK